MEESETYKRVIIDSNFPRQRMSRRWQEKGVNWPNRTLILFLSSLLRSRHELISWSHLRLFLDTYPRIPSTILFSVCDLLYVFVWSVYIWWIFNGCRKRVFPGGSSSGCQEADVVEIPPPINRSSKAKLLKQKEVKDIFIWNPLSFVHWILVASGYRFSSYFPFWSGYRIFIFYFYFF